MCEGHVGGGHGEVHSVCVDHVGGTMGRYTQCV